MRGYLNHDADWSYSITTFVYKSLILSIVQTKNIAYILTDKNRVYLTKMYFKWVKSDMGNKFDKL